MRKFILCMTMLSLLIVPYAAFAVTTNPYSDFELKYDSYEIDNSVIIRDDGGNYYGDTTGYRVNPWDFNFVATISGDFTSKDLPFGTLTFLGSNDVESNQILIRPNLYNFSDDKTKTVKYYANGYTGQWTGQRAMYNLNTSPDIMVGAFDIPEEGRISFDADEIVPYVRINYSKDVEGTLMLNLPESVELSFVKYGDWDTPIATDFSHVNISFEYGEEFTSGEDVHDYRRDSVNEHYDNFEGTETIVLGEEDSDFVATYRDIYDIRVTYVKDGTQYTWRFERGGKEFEIDWGELALENGPLEIVAGEEKEITLKLPSYINIMSPVSDYDEDGNRIGEHEELIEDNVVRTGNNDIAMLDSGSMEFEQGKGISWDETVYEDNLSTLKFTLLANDPGKTTLNLRLWENYCREIHVLSADGTMPAGGENTSGLRPTVTSHTSRVLMINDKPYYPSAEFNRMNLSLVGKEAIEHQEIDEDGNVIKTWYDAPAHEGYVGVTDDNVSEIYIARYDDNDYRLSQGEGVRYNSLDAEDNYELATGLSDENLSNYYIWWEFPESKDMNLVSASLSAILSGDFVTTTEQLETFAPYIEFNKGETDDGYREWLEWKFIDKDGKAVTPSGVTNIRVGWADIEDGTFSGQVYDYGGSWEDGFDVIQFYYDYQGITYTWNFCVYRGGSWGTGLGIGEKQACYENLENSDEYESITLFVDSTDIISVSPTTITPAEEISFDVEGLKEGRAAITMLLTRKTGTPFEKYEFRFREFYVYEWGTEQPSTEDGDNEENITVTIESSDLITSFDRLTADASIIEGTVYEYDDGGKIQLTLTRAKEITSEQYNENYEALRGILRKLASKIYGRDFSALLKRKRQEL